MGVSSLLVYEASSTTGENITILADAESSISCLEKQEAPKMGPAAHIGGTKITGIGNILIADHANTIACSLETSFGQTWSEILFQVALIKDIAVLPAYDNTLAIQCALHALWSKMPAFMIEHEQFSNQPVWQCIFATWLARTSSTPKSPYSIL